VRRDHIRERRNASVGSPTPGGAPLGTGGTHRRVAPLTILATEHRGVRAVSRLVPHVPTVEALCRDGAVGMNVVTS
jgi:hypothetical protein